MRVDYRHYVRDLALGAITRSAGVELSRLCAKSERLSEYKNPKFVLDPSWRKPLRAPFTNGVAHPWVQGEQLRRPEFKRVGLVKSCVL
jgi:hypothetical protein